MVIDDHGHQLRIEKITFLIPSQQLTSFFYLRSFENCAWY